MINKILFLNSFYKKTDLKNWIPVSIFVFTLLKNIKDPEFSYNLYNLDILSIEKILVENHNINQNIHIGLLINPTYDLCTMSSIIGLSIRNILYNRLTQIVTKTIFPKNWNWNYYMIISPILYSNNLIITKQLNDKERVSAAIENISIRNIVKFSYYKITSE